MWINFRETFLCCKHNYFQLKAQYKYLNKQWALDFQSTSNQIINSCYIHWTVTKYSQRFWLCQFPWRSNGQKLNRTIHIRWYLMHHRDKQKWCNNLWLSESLQIMSFYFQRSISLDTVLPDPVLSVNISHYFNMGNHLKSVRHLINWLHKRAGFWLLLLFCCKPLTLG